MIGGWLGDVLAVLVCGWLLLFIIGMSWSPPP
jgi:hypothetical protein